MKKEFVDPTGKRIRQTYEEYVRYYHRPRTNFSDANPALLFIGKNTPVGSDNFGFLPTTAKSPRAQTFEPSTEL